MIVKHSSNRPKQTLFDLCSYSEEDVSMKNVIDSWINTFPNSSIINDYEVQLYKGKFKIESMLLSGQCKLRFLLSLYLYF